MIVVNFDVRMKLSQTEIWNNSSIVRDCTNAPAPNCNPVFVVTAVTVASDNDMRSVCYEAVERGHADRGGQ